MRMTSNLNAMILVGGKGTRLRRVVSDRPKPMAEVAGRPFVEWLVLELRRQGIQRVVFGTGYMGEVVESYFGTGNNWDMDFVYSREPVPLGTAGAIRHALDCIHGDRFLVMNGDSFCCVDIRRMQDAHRTHKARATLWLLSVDDCRRYGSVRIDRGNAIRGFREKSVEKRSGLVNAGVYLLERDIVETIPEARAVSIETEFFPEQIGRGLYGVLGEGPFLDIGTPEAYAGAERFFAENQIV